MSVRSNTATPIVIRRLIEHVPERVFDAFSHSKALVAWLAPSDDIVATAMEHDFNVGGRYRVAFALADGNQTVLAGEFVVIERPSKICFTWVWEEPDIHAGIQSLVTVDLLEADGGTELIINHENLSTIEAVDRHTQGWLGTIKRLCVWLDMQH